MAWSLGTFTRTNGVYTGSAVWQSDAAAAVKINAGRHDTHDKDLADGINACLHKGGQNTPTADIGWGGYKITGLGNGASSTDAATFGQTITAASWDSGTQTVTLTRSAGNITVTLTGIGSGTWGSVTGTLSAQTDLWTRLTTLPQNSTSTGVTLALTDAGGHVRLTSTGDTVTVPPNSSVAFGVGSVVLVVNDYSNTNTITPGSGVTLRKTWNGTTGAVTVGAYGMVQLTKISTDTWFVTGVNVS